MFSSEFHGSWVMVDAHSSSSNAEPTPSEDTISIRAGRLRIVRQYDAAVERVLEATLGRISKLLDNGVMGESVSHYYPEYSDAHPDPPHVLQEAKSEKVSVRDGNRFSTAIERQLVFFAALLFLFMSGALGRYAQIGHELVFGW